MERLFKITYSENLDSTEKMTLEQALSGQLKVAMANTHNLVETLRSIPSTDNINIQDIGTLDDNCLRCMSVFFYLANPDEYTILNFRLGEGFVLPFILPPNKEISILEFLVMKNEEGEYVRVPFQLEDYIDGECYYGECEKGNENLYQKLMKDPSLPNPWGITPQMQLNTEGEVPN